MKHVNYNVKTNIYIYIINMIIYFKKIFNKWKVHDGKLITLKHNGPFRTIVDIVKTDGCKGLYQGLSPNLIGNTVSWGIYFWM